jgi:UDP-glucose 4-epimerase
VLVLSGVLFLLAGAICSRVSLARADRKTVAGTPGTLGRERNTLVSEAGSVDDRPVLLVTGGAGFVGSHIAARFAASWRVVLLDDCSTGKETNIPEGVEFVPGDICRYEDLLHVFDLGPIDAVVHCAAQTSVARSMADPDLDWGVNVGGTAKLVRLARERGVRRFVFL